MSFLPEEYRKKIARIEWATKKMASELMSGAYKSAFRGSGMSFSDFREYVPGDDVRSISWSLYAKTQSPFIKTYDEERELSVYALVDTSESLKLGFGAYSKIEVAMYLMSFIGFVANKNQDHFGLGLWSSSLEFFSPAKKGDKYVRSLLKKVIEHEFQGRSTEFKNILLDVRRSIPKKSILFFISDFQCEIPLKDLRLLNQKHNIVAVAVDDIFEKNLKPYGRIQVFDPETQSKIFINSSSKKQRDVWEKNHSDFRVKRKESFKKAGVSFIELTTEDDFLDQFIRFLNKKGTV